MQQTLKGLALALLTLIAIQLAGCGVTQGIQPSQATANQFMLQM